MAETSSERSGGAKSLMYADIGLVIFFAFLAWVAISTRSDASSFWYVFSLFTYIAAKVIGAKVCTYVKFSTFISSQDKRSANGILGLSGFSAFKGALVAMIAVGFVLISHWILVGEAVLVVLMRVWAKGYD
jgi:hypothetical protein